jgi:hypothetical protein
MMIPLLDRTGTVKAWADRQTGWISDLTGKVFALVSFALTARGWADFGAFLGALGHTQTAPEKLRDFRERIETQLPRE